MAEDGIRQRKVSGSCNPGKMSLLSCGPEQSFVTPPETGGPWDVQEEAQGHLSSLSEGFSAPWPAWEGLGLCWLLQPGSNQHKEAFVIKVLNR